MSPRRTLTVAVRVRPGASRVRVGGRYAGPLGPAIVVAVTAPAVDGRATEAALRATARALGLRRGELALRSGATSRDKLFIVGDPPADLADRIEALLGADDTRGNDSRARKTRANGDRATGTGGDRATGTDGDRADGTDGDLPGGRA
jgi:hypothetical protein